MNDVVYKRGGKASPDINKKLKKRWTRNHPFVIICICIGLLVLFLLSPVFDVAEIQVNGIEKTTYESIVQASGIVKGASIFKVNSGKAEKLITSMAFVDCVHVKKKFPHTVVIDITESKEVAYIYFIGNYVGIDEKGKILEIKQSDSGIELPVIVGTRLTEFGIGNYIKTDNEANRDAVFKILGQVNEAGISNLLKVIDVTDLNDIKFVTVSDATVNIGTMDEIIYKISFLKKILEDPADKRGAVIDMTNTEKVTVRGS